MYNIVRPLAESTERRRRRRHEGEGEREREREREGRRGLGGSTQFIKESTARNLRLLLTPGCRNLCELLTKEWRSFRYTPP